MAYADRGKKIHCFSCRPIDTVRCHLGYIVLEVRSEALVLLKSQLMVQGIESQLPLTLHVMSAIGNGTKHAIDSAAV